MNISLLNASNNNMMSMMQSLMKGMQQSSQLQTDMVAVNLENSISAEKMDMAQHIIDVYA